MAKVDTHCWESGGTFLEGECDVPDCHGEVNHRRFYYPTYMNGDAECEASLCNKHKEYKNYNTTKKIQEVYKEKNKTPTP